MQKNKNNKTEVVEKMRIVKHVLPILFIAVITAVISRLLYVDMMKHEEKRSWQELKTTAQSVNNEIETKFNDEIAKLHLIETIMLNDEIFSATDVDFLHIDDVEATTIFSRIDILYPDNVLLSDGKERIINQNIKFDEVAAKGEYISKRKTDFLTEKQCIYYVLPVLNGEKTEAVLIGVIDAKELSKTFKPIIYNGKANICIIDSEDGNYIMDSWHKELGNAYVTPDREKIKGYENIDLKSEMKNRRTGAVAFMSRTTGKSIYMYYEPMNIYGWQLAIFASKETLFSNMISLKKRFVAGGVAEVMLLVLYFMWNIYLIRQLEKSNAEIESQRKQLKHLSYRDSMTSLYNRNKYTEVLHSFEGSEICNIGVAYIDLNGLKQINDFKSHDVGDEYICKAAKIISEFFAENCYRIGGDEFVVLAVNTECEEFETAVQRFGKTAEKEDVSVSVGAVWKNKCENLNGMLKEAEQKMYVEKKIFHGADEE